MRPSFPWLNDVAVVNGRRGVIVAIFSHHFSGGQCGYKVRHDDGTTTWSRRADLEPVRP